MKRRTSKIAAAVAVVAAVAAGGAAFTDSNTLAASVAGYAQSDISGATATKITYTLNSDGTQITDAALTFQGDVTDKVIVAGFDGDATLLPCVIGAYTAGAPGSTAVTCSGFTQSTATSQKFNVAVTDQP